MTSVAITSINMDGGTQPRAAIDFDVVEEYALALASGAVFPPAVVFFDGSTYWLADGFHRTHAHKVAERQSIECDVRQGTRRDAILFDVTGQRRRVTNQAPPPGRRLRAQDSKIPRALAQP